MLNLAQRNVVNEIMDDLSLPKEKLIPVYAGLNRLNYFSGTSFFLAREIRKLIPKKQNSLTLLDIGCGSGEVLCQMANYFKRQGLIVKAMGIDINPHSIEVANKNAKLTKSPVEFFVADVSTALKDLTYDLVCSSLFLHHLSEKTIVEIFSLIKERASLGLVMSDLERSKIGYLMTYAATRLLSRSTIVHQDGLKSVQAALTKSEFLNLSKKAGLNNCLIKGIYPCHLLLSWQKK